MRKLNEIFDTKYDTLVKDIKTNTKEIEDGDLFVCIKGFNVDRHDYVDEAKRKGAKALIVEHTVDSDLPQIIVPNINDNFADICTKFYDEPSKKMIMIGITGTDGKTTTSTIIYELLNQIVKTGYIGTNGVNCPNYVDHSNNTTPTSEHLNRFLNNFYNKGCKVVSMEAGSEGLAQGRCKNIEFDYSVFTNLTHEHLNFHKTMDNYMDAKGILFKQTKKDGYSLINIDDEYGKKISKYCNGKVLYYGKDENADFRFTNVVITPYGTTFDLNYNNQVYNIKSPLLGMFNVYNLTAALGILILMGYNIKDFDLSNLFIDGRMNDINLGQDFKVIVDYAHTPNGYLNLFELTKTIKCNKTIIVANSALKYLEKFGLNVICLDSDASQKTLSDAEELLSNKSNSYIIMFKGQELNDNVNNLLEKYPDVSKLELHKLDNITDTERSNKENYTSIMRDNLELIKKELYQ